MQNQEVDLNKVSENIQGSLSYLLSLAGEYAGTLLPVAAETVRANLKQHQTGLQQSLSALSSHVNSQDSTLAALQQELKELKDVQQEPATDTSVRKEVDRVPR